jgi:hypothetical protein
MRNGRRLNSAAKTRLALPCLALPRAPRCRDRELSRGLSQRALTLAASANFAKNSIFRARARAPSKIPRAFSSGDRDAEKKRPSGRGSGEGGGREREGGRAGNVPNALAHSSAFRCCRPTRRNAARLPEYQARNCSNSTAPGVQPPPSPSAPALRPRGCSFLAEASFSSRGTPEESGERFSEGRSAISPR